ncbi:MAG: PBSX family phage terminase large subunit [Exiguobacterium sp.]|nr:PBSX family phage terminase large subunit [Exiguobacterium sp.]
MANPQNLLKGKNTQFKKGEEQAKIGRKGGIASGKAKRARASMALLARQIADSPISSEKTRKTLESLGIESEDLTNGAVVVASVYKGATSGDIKAVEKWQELTEIIAKDDKPYKLPAEVLGSAFVDINRNIEPNKTYIFKGGRGGLKSSYISLKIVELIKNNPDLHACIVRKVGSTLKDSVYSQMRWAINVLGLEDEFKAKSNPMEIIYKKTGQKIYFRGVDDPIKLKSIKPEFGYIGILWIEERDQLNGADEERSVKQSVLRGGAVSYDFASYNPPKSSNSWVNQEEKIPNDNRIIHVSDYRSAPKEWLGQKFIDDAEHLKETNPKAYEHEYLGVSNGEGGQVFEFVEIREIKDAEIKKFDRIYQGVDWGWYPDIYAFERVYYDSARETLYVFAENTGNKMRNQQTAQWIIDHEFDDYRITCDSAEPKSVNDYKDMGLPAIPAIKGAGSIEYSFKWLACRKIIIDPVRCPVATKEFLEYEYDRDKDGNVVSGYPDKNNHTIDAVRYATEQFWTRRGNQA